jgi:hypothetical protein
MATNKLTDRTIQAAKPKETEYELVDGKGLTLRVRSNGGKLWFVRYMSPTSKRVRSQRAEGCLRSQSTLLARRYF